MEADLVPLSRMFEILFTGHYVARRRDTILNGLMWFVVGLVVGMIFRGRQ